MKKQRRLALFLAAVMLSGLAACGTMPAEDVSENHTQTTAVEAAENSTKPQAKPAETLPTEPQLTMQPAQTEEDEEAQKQIFFAYGTWNDGKNLEYTFNTDGTGTLRNVSANTTETFRFEVNEKRGRIVFRVGEKEKKETVSYTVKDDTHIVLTYAGKQTVALTFGELITKSSTPFRMGTWKTADGQNYVFRLDGSGAILDEETETGVAFQYEVDSDSNLLIMHIGSVDDLTAGVYTLQGDKKMRISFDSGMTELTWVSDKT